MKRFPQIYVLTKCVHVYDPFFFFENAIRFNSQKLM